MGWSGVEFVEDWLGQALGCWEVVGADVVDDDNLVGAFAEPASGEVEGLLWAYVPISAEVVAVDEHVSFAEGLEVEVGVAYVGEVERGTVVAWGLGGVLGVVEGVEGGLVVVGDGAASPVGEGVGVEEDGGEEAFVVVDVGAVVYSAHGVDEDVDVCRVRGWGDKE